MSRSPALVLGLLFVGGVSCDRPQSSSDVPPAGKASPSEGKADAKPVPDAKSVVPPGGDAKAVEASSAADARGEGKTSGDEDKAGDDEGKTASADGGAAASDTRTPSLPPPGPAAANLGIVVVHHGELLGSQLRNILKLRKQLEAKVGAVRLAVQPANAGTEAPLPPEGSTEVTDTHRERWVAWLEADEAARDSLMTDPAWATAAFDRSAEAEARTVLVLRFAPPHTQRSGKRLGRGVESMGLLRRDAEGVYELMHVAVEGSFGLPFPKRGFGDGAPGFVETLLPFIDTASASASE